MQLLSGDWKLTSFDRHYLNAYFKKPELSFKEQRQVLMLLFLCMKESKAPAAFHLLSAKRE